MKFFFCILFFISLVSGQKIYINSADYQELKSLPLSQDKVSDLYDFIIFQKLLLTCVISAIIERAISCGVLDEIFNPIGA